MMSRADWPASRHARVIATFRPFNGRCGMEPSGWGAFQLEADTRPPGQQEIFKVYNSSGRSRIVVGHSNSDIARRVFGVSGLSHSTGRGGLA